MPRPLRGESHFAPRSSPPCRCSLVQPDAWFAPPPPAALDRRGDHRRPLPLLGGVSRPCPRCIVGRRHSRWVSGSSHDSPHLHCGWSAANCLPIACEHRLSGACCRATVRLQHERSKGGGVTGGEGGAGGGCGGGHRSLPCGRRPGRGGGRAARGEFLLAPRAAGAPSRRGALRRDSVSPGAFADRTGASRALGRAGTGWGRSRRRHAGAR